MAHWMSVSLAVGQMTCSC